jgi:hypothetical protein
MKSKLTSFCNQAIANETSSFIIYNLRNALGVSLGGPDLSS